MTGPYGETSVNWGALKKTAEDATRPLPDDWYDVTVVKSEFKLASTGSPMITATLEVDSGPHKTRRLFTNFVLTPENGFALGIFFNNMKAFGFDDNFFAQLTQSGLDLEAGMVQIAAQLQNRSARVQVGTRQWQGQDRNECKTFSARQGGPSAPGVVTGPASFAGPTGPSSPSPAAPATPASPAATPATVPGPPPPPSPAF